MMVLRNILKKQNKISFGNKAVMSLFATSLLIQAGAFILSTSSALIVSRIVGGDALCAVNLISPLYSYAIFFSGTISIGSTFLCFRYLGAYKKDRANEIFGQSIMLAVVLGILLLIAMMIGKNAYLDGLNISEAVRAEAEAYWKTEQFLIAFTPIDYLLSELLHTDIRVTIIAQAVLFSVGVGTSIIFTSAFGTMGAGLGMLVGTLASDLVFCQHFFGKKNIFSFKLHFSWHDIKEMCRLSLVDASGFLITGLITAFINSYVLRHFSESMLPVTSVMLTVLGFGVVFDSVGVAFSPVAEVYLGEGNNSDEKATAQFSLSLAVVFGLVVSLVLFVFAPLIPALFDLTDPEQIKTTVTVIRLFAPYMTFNSVSFMLISHYIAIRKIPLAVTFEWTLLFIMPVICILIFGKIFGFNGVWGCFVPASILTTIGFVVVSRLFAGKKRSVWLLEDNKYPTFSRSYYVSEETSVCARDDIGCFLTEKQISDVIIMQVEMVIEEMTLLLLEVNRDRKKVIIQYTVIVEDDCIRLYERDNGLIYDLSDSNADITSFGHYVYSRLVENCVNKRYLMAIDFNRSVFCFRI